MYHLDCVPADAYFFKTNRDKCGWILLCAECKRWIGTHAHAHTSHNVIESTIIILFICKLKYNPS